MFVAGALLAGSPDPSRVCGTLEALLPGAAAVALTGEGDPGLLLAGERPFLGRAGPRRASEFAAGRFCARQAAARLGVVAGAIGAHADRRPDWPAALAGSITHTEDFAAAAVGLRPRFCAIGIDAERIGRLERELWPSVFVLTELTWLLRLPEPVRDTAATLLYSAKEAFYKCQYELLREPLEFRDVAVECRGRDLALGQLSVLPASGSVGWFGLTGGPATVRFAVRGDLVLTAMAHVAH